MNKWLWLLFGLVALFLVYQVVDTYGLLESDAAGRTELNIGRWEIAINNLDVSEVTTLSFTDLVYEANANVEDGYFAPGSKGSYEIVIDPKDTDVAIRYDISINLDVLEGHTNIKFEVTNSNLALVSSNDGLTYSGVITLAEIQNGDKKNLTISLMWENDENYNEFDSELAKIDATLSFPLEIKFTQYNGEPL